MISGEQTVEVKAGDSVHYAADIHHKVINLTNEPSVAFLIVRYRH